MDANATLSVYDAQDARLKYAVCYGSYKTNQISCSNPFLSGIDLRHYTEKSVSLQAMRLSEKQRVTKSITQMALDYEDEKNAMIAKPETENTKLYEDFYEELDNRIIMEQSMNMLFFGPPSSFLRIDPESILHILVHTKKHLIPATRVLLAWDLLTDGKTAAYLQGRELLAFGSLLNIVPEEDLYYLNFGDPSVLRYFSSNSLNLHRRKYGVLVAAYRRYFGSLWYTNSSRINDLGYLLCGFPSTDLKKITPETFREVNINVLSKLKSCTGNQTQTLYKIASHPEAYGEPYKWSSHEIGRLNALFTCIPEEDISSIQLEAVSAISPIVMKSINQKKLEYFTKQQIMRMHPKTRRIYILRMQLRHSLDMSLIINRRTMNGCRHSIFIPNKIICILVTLLFRGPVDPVVKIM